MPARSLLFSQSAHLPWSSRSGLEYKLDSATLFLMSTSGLSTSLSLGELGGGSMASFEKLIRRCCSGGAEEGGWRASGRTCERQSKG